jgi:hypothetical protein
MQPSDWINPHLRNYGPSVREGRVRRRRQAAALQGVDLRSTHRAGFTPR